MDTHHKCRDAEGPVRSTACARQFQISDAVGGRYALWQMANEAVMRVCRCGLIFQANKLATNAQLSYLPTSNDAACLGHDP